MAVVILLLMCGWISIINAQPNTVTILPQEHQSVCSGESVSYNCIGSGVEMALFSPPIVNESDRFILFSSQNVETSLVTPNSAAAIVLVDTMGDSQFVVTYILYIAGQVGQVPVICRVTAADGMVTRNETTLSVLESPYPIITLDFQVSGCSCENMMQVPVNVSWNSPENAQEFTLQIIGENMDYDSTTRYHESSITVLLPYFGTYSATVCAINRCGKRCWDRNIFSVNKCGFCPSPISESLVIALAVVVGILGLLLILIFIYAVVVTVIICTSKKDKLSAQAIPTDEMKMQ